MAACLKLQTVNPHCLISCNRWGELADKHGQKQKFWVSESLALCCEAEEKESLQEFSLENFFPFISLSGSIFFFPLHFNFLTFSCTLLFSSFLSLNYNIIYPNFKTCFIHSPTYTCGFFLHSIFYLKSNLNSQILF